MHAFNHHWQRGCAEQELWLVRLPQSTDWADTISDEANIANKRAQKVEGFIFQCLYNLYCKGGMRLIRLKIKYVIENQQFGG